MTVRLFCRCAFVVLYEAAPYHCIGILRIGAYASVAHQDYSPYVGVGCQWSCHEADVLCRQQRVAVVEFIGCPCLAVVGRRYYVAVAVEGKYQFAVRAQQLPYGCRCFFVPCCAVGRRYDVVAVEHVQFSVVNDGVLVCIGSQRCVDVWRCCVPSLSVADVGIEYARCRFGASHYIHASVQFECAHVAEIPEYASYGCALPFKLVGLLLVYVYGCRIFLCVDTVVRVDYECSRLREVY